MFDLQAVLASDATVSDKIRALNAEGYRRAEIARLLGKRYQHVRNVLEADKITRGVASVGEAPRAWSDEGFVQSGKTYRLAVTEAGDLRLPEGLRKALRLRPGGVAIAEFQDDRLVVLSTQAAVRRAQDLFAALDLDPGRSLADELIEDRRREAREEDGRG